MPSLIPAAATITPSAAARPATRRGALLLAVVAIGTLVLGACNSADESTNYSAINSLRSSVGVPALARSGELDAKARKQAERMAKRGSIYHSTNLAAGVSPGWTLIGENVASAGTVEDAQGALVASPPHYENLTNPAFTEVGVGVYAKNGTVYVVQIFVAR